MPNTIIVNKQHTVSVPGLAPKLLQVDDATILRSPATGAKLTHVEVVHRANAML